MPSLLHSPPQHPAAGAWGSLYAVQEPVKSRHVLVAPAPAMAKKPAYGGRKKNLETCTEALGCETGAVDVAPAGYSADNGDGGVEDECAERNRRSREEEEETMEGKAHWSGHRSLPPPLTTLARGASRVRMVHDRRDGRLAVYVVRAPVVEAERSGGRLRMRLLPLPLPCGGAGNAGHACHRQEPEAEKEAAKEDVEEYGVAKYERGGRCVEPEGGAAAARRSKQWEPTAFWVATS